MSTFDIHCGAPETPAEVPRVIVRPPLLTFERMSVRSEGEMIVINIGNSDLHIHYSEALKLSQWLRVQAKQSKRRCGDTSRHWSALATLDGLT